MPLSDGRGIPPRGSRRVVRSFQCWVGAHTRTPDGDEVGIDISGQQSKGVSVFDGWSFDFVIMVCEGDACPFLTGETGIILVWSFEDPAQASGTDDEVLAVFRKIRDGIEDSVHRFIVEYG